jgi:hypothetical protein
MGNAIKACVDSKPKHKEKTDQVVNPHKIEHDVALVVEKDAVYVDPAGIRSNVQPKLPQLVEKPIKNPRVPQTYEEQIKEYNGNGTFEDALRESALEYSIMGNYTEKML